MPLTKKKVTQIYSTALNSLQYRRNKHNFQCVNVCCHLPFC